MEKAIEAGVRTRRTGRNGGHDVTERATEWRNLVADVEDLIKKVANVDDAEIAEMRARVEQTLARAKGVAKEGVANVRGYAREATAVTDEYVHESPWQAIGIAAAVGVLVGFIATRRY
jgi:ElaB/YqjD/DUF883 family membrane-anchored ribosome-binding protein